MAKNKIHSVLTALPLLMLLVALFFYFRAEKAQTGGELILQESVVEEVSFAGLSKIKTGSGVGKHYFWFTQIDKRRGARVDYYDLPEIESLAIDEPLKIWLAPRVAGSTTLWLYRVEREGEVLLDRQD